MSLPAEPSGVTGPVLDPFALEVHRYTRALEVAWRIADEEAFGSRSTEIQPIHLLAGVIRLQELFVPDIGASIAHSAVDLVMIRCEWLEVENLLKICGFTPQAARVLRVAFAPTAPAANPDWMLPLAERSQRIFARASQLTGDDVTAINLHHVLLAILESRGFEVVLLDLAGIDVAKLEKLLRQQCDGAAGPKAVA